MKILALFLLSTSALLADTRAISFYDNYGQNGCRACNGRWSVHNRTASGVRPKVGVTVAANDYPFGTRIYIRGIGTRIVQDRLANPKSRRIDVFVKTHKEAIKLGIQYRKVKVL